METTGFKCPICRIELATHEYYSMHLDKHSGVEYETIVMNERKKIAAVKNPFPFKCDNCGLEFSRKDTLKLHVTKDVCKNTGMRYIMRFIDENATEAEKTILRQKLGPEPQRVKIKPKPQEKPKPTVYHINVDLEKLAI